MSDQPDPSAADAPEPLLRVVAGHPTPEELAALVAVIAARRAGAADAAAGSEPPQRTAWGDPRRVVRMTHHHGPGHWRRSAFPR